MGDTFQIRPQRQCRAFETDRPGGGYHLSHHRTRYVELSIICLIRFKTPTSWGLPFDWAGRLLFIISRPSLVICRKQLFICFSKIRSRRFRRMYRTPTWEMAADSLSAYWWQSLHADRLLLTHSPFFRLSPKRSGSRFFSWLIVALFVFVLNFRGKNRLAVCLFPPLCMPPVCGDN